MEEEINFMDVKTRHIKEVRKMIESCDLSCSTCTKVEKDDCHSEMREAISWLIDQMENMMITFSKMMGMQNTHEEMFV